VRGVAGRHQHDESEQRDFTKHGLSPFCKQTEMSKNTPCISRLKFS
jgi:hypothetical protein